MHILDFGLLSLFHTISDINHNQNFAVLFMRTNLFRGLEGKKINFNSKEVRKGLGQSNDDGLLLIIIQGLQNDSMNA